MFVVMLEHSFTLAFDAKVAWTIIFFTVDLYVFTMKGFFFQISYYTRMLELP